LGWGCSGIAASSLEAVTTGGVDFGLSRLVAAGDLDGVLRVIKGLDSADWPMAAAWYATNRRVITRGLGWDGDLRDQALSGEDADWLDALLLAAFASGGDAGRSMPWRRYWTPRGPRRPALVEMMLSRGERWAAEFAEAASGLRPPSRLLRVRARAVFDLVEEVVRRCDLPLPGGAMFVLGWMAGYPYEPSADDIISGMATDPLMPDIHDRLLASGEVGRWHHAAEATARLVAAGSLERNDLVARCFALLRAGLPPLTERTLANVLRLLDVDWSEVPDAHETTAFVLENCHDSVSALFLPWAFSEAMSASQVGRLISLAAQRREKRIKRLALDGLRSARDRGLLSERESSELAAVLRVTLEDRASQRALESIAGQASPAPDASTDLWQASPPPELLATPTRRLPSTEHIDAFLERSVKGAMQQYAPNATLRDRLIWASSVDGLLRRAVSDPRGAAALLASLEFSRPAPGHWQESVAEALYDASVAGDPVASYVAVLPQVAAGPRWIGTDLVGPHAAGSTAAAFNYIVLRESLARLGRAPLMLSRPTWDDGTIDYDDLVDRLPATAAVGFGPYDLLQALLRLRVPSVDRLAALDGLSVPLDRSLTSEAHPCQIAEATAAIRLWIVGEGVPEPELAPVEGTPLGAIANTANLPLSPSLFGPLELSPRLDVRWGMPAECIAVQPFWGDLFFVEDLYAPPSNFSGDTSLAKLLAAGAFVPGKASLHRLAAEMVSTVAGVRLQAARTLVQLVTAQRFEVAPFIDAVISRNDHGVQPLARTIRALEDAMLLGVMSEVWPVLIGLADRVCERTVAPSGTDVLLRTLVRYAPSIPEPVVPHSVRRFAASSGTSKAVHEARALVVAVDGP
jgi:hypothetical protein